MAAGSPLEGTVLGRRGLGEKPIIAQILARVGGSDGVWLEVQKQLAMWGDTYDFVLITGEIECPLRALEPCRRTATPLEEGRGGGEQALKQVILVPSLAFSDPENARIEETLRELGRLGGPSVSEEEADRLVERIAVAARELQSALGRWISPFDRLGVEHLIVQNLQAIPMHKPAGLAIHHLFNDPPELGGVRFGGKLILHHHDLTRDRMPERYLPARALVQVPDLESEALGEVDRWLGSKLLEQIALAYAIDPRDPGAKPLILRRWRADFERSVEASLVLGSDQSAARFPELLGSILDRASELWAPSSTAPVSPELQEHLAWLLSHGRVSTQPILSSKLWSRVLDLAFPSRVYRNAASYELWAINRGSAAGLERLGASPVTYVPNVFEFAESWEATMARAVVPCARSRNQEVARLLASLGVRQEDGLLTSLVRLVPRKNLELSLDALFALRLRSPARRLWLLIVGRAGDEGLEYEAHLRAYAQARGLEGSVLWLGGHLGSGDPGTGLFSPFEWTRFFRTRRALEIYPSTVEGWGNRLGELAEAGVAVLVHPYRVLRETIVPDLEALGFATPFETIGYRELEGPGRVVEPRALETALRLLEDPDAYDAYARRVFEAMRSAYDLNAVRRRMERSIPSRRTTGPDL